MDASYDIVKLINNYWGNILNTSKIENIENFDSDEIKKAFKALTTKTGEIYNAALSIILSKLLIDNLKFTYEDEKIISIQIVIGKYQKDDIDVNHTWLHIKTNKNEWHLDLCNAQWSDKYIVSSPGLFPMFIASEQDFINEGYVITNERFYNVGTIESILQKPLENVDELQSLESFSPLHWTLAFKETRNIIVSFIESQKANIVFMSALTK